MSKVTAVLVSACLVTGFTPMAGVFAEEVSENVVMEETPLLEEAPIVETPVVETPVAETPVAETPVVEETIVPEETPIVEAPTDVEAPLPEETPVDETPVIEAPLPEEAPITEVSSNEAVSEDAVGTIDVKASLATGKPAEYLDPLDFDLATASSYSTDATITAVKYYAQPLYYTNKDYDCVVAYLTNEKGEYAYRTYFITDGTEWLMYDYGETMAKEFFSQTTITDGRYIPVKKADSRKDNSSTNGIDESKIPTMTEAAWRGMVYDWRTLANVPFTRNASGLIVYAGTGQEDNPNPTPAPDPDSSQYQYVLTINSSTYDIRVTKSVAYTGKRHVTSTAKETSKQSADLKIDVYRNGTLVEPKYYTLKYGNNINVNGYGKADAIPYFRITLKNVKPYKKDSKLLAFNKFAFTIVPVDISKVNFNLKKVRVTGTKVSLNTPTVKIGGRTLKLSPKGTKNPLTGAFTASFNATNNTVTIVGANNYAGSTEINLLAAKSIDYVF